MNRPQHLQALRSFLNPKKFQAKTIAKGFRLYSRTSSCCQIENVKTVRFTHPAPLTAYLTYCPVPIPVAVLLSGMSENTLKLLWSISESR